MVLLIKVTVGFFLNLYCLLYFKGEKAQLLEHLIPACNLRILRFSIFLLIFNSAFEKIIKRYELDEVEHYDQQACQEEGL